MQLPPRDEIVMVAGTPPIRAKKVRYYEDRRFTERVLPPPDPAAVRPVIANGRMVDAWNAEAGGGSNRQCRNATEDTANSGLRREPELPDHVAIVKETTEPTPAEEFAVVLDDDEDAVRQSRLHTSTDARRCPPGRA